MKLSVQTAFGAAALLLIAVAAASTAVPDASSETAEPAVTSVGVPDPENLPHGTGVNANGAPYVRGQVLVTFAGESEPRIVRIPTTADPEQAADSLASQAGIRDASPNYLAHISGWFPNDSGLMKRLSPARGWMGRQWNFLPCADLCGQPDSGIRPRSRGGINALAGWRFLRRAKRPGASGVRVAVLDTGLAYRDYRGFRRNPDLARKRILPGYDFVKKNRLPLDRNGHGTHVASTIAQTTNNRFGLTGVAYKAKLIPVRVMNANGFGSAAHVVAGIRWAMNHRAQVIVMSINFDCGEEIPALSRVLEKAHRKGVVLVASAGNRLALDCPSLPATAPQVISVGGSTESGCVGDYSFRSPLIDLVAPGGGDGYLDCPWQSRNRPIMQASMDSLSTWKFEISKEWVGTSMAAAHVAGAAAAVLASGVLKKKRGPAQVRQRLLGTARLPEGVPASGYGAGIVDLGRALDPKVIVGSQ